MFTISNSQLEVQVAAKGAELQSIIHKQNGLEYLWSGDAAYWGKKSPVLFPVVGGLRNNQYQYNGKTYELGRHGFARDLEFEVTHQAADTIVFTLYSSTEILSKYPFHFQFSVQYTLYHNQLAVEYIVENLGHEQLWFSVGGHPAFKLPLVGGTSFSDYYLSFNHTENSGRWPLSAEGLIEKASLPFLKNTRQLPLQKSLFYEDAIVFKDLQSDAISIQSNVTKHGLTVHFPGFPFMGIWSTKDADFVCIEPWLGIADSVDASGKLEEKEGIHSLDAHQSFRKGWSVEFF